MLAETLDRNCDTNGFNCVAGDQTDWTDIPHSKRKKRDRYLDDNIILKLSQKSDWEGFRRLFENLSILLLTGYSLRPALVFCFESGDYRIAKIIFFCILYFFYGFQIQCFGYAAQHETMHRTAFKTKWINELFLFCFSLPSFEFGRHEQVMHRQHHTYTNNIDRDPELTSFWTREVLVKKGFRKVASSRWDFILEFFDLFGIIYSHIMRMVNSACGIPVDYTGVRWSLKEYAVGKDVMRQLQSSAQLQLSLYAIVFSLCLTDGKKMTMLLMYWVVPAVLGFIPINFIRNCEHADCEISTGMNCLRNTRSTKSCAIIRQLLWNMNFHAEHHLYPSVPFYNLPKLHQLLRGSILNGNIDSFTAQNWECIKTDGWIDLQTRMK